MSTVADVVPCSMVAPAVPSIFDDGAFTARAAFILVVVPSISTVVPSKSKVTALTLKVIPELILILPL